VVSGSRQDVLEHLARTATSSRTETRLRGLLEGLHHEPLRILNLLSWRSDLKCPYADNFIIKQTLNIDQDLYHGFVIDVDKLV
jgi:hypothetical protein